MLTIFPLLIERHLDAAERATVVALRLDPKAAVDVKDQTALSFAHAGESFDQATGLAARAAIMSPEFLFRMERDPHPDRPR